MGWTEMCVLILLYSGLFLQMIKHQFVFVFCSFQKLLNTRHSFVVQVYISLNNSVLQCVQLNWLLNTVVYWTGFGNEAYEVKWIMSVLTTTNPSSTENWCSRAFNWGSIWIQLIQQYVKKSNTTSFPFNSLAKDSSFFTFSQSKPKKQYKFN